MDDRAAKKALQSNFDGIRARGRLQKRSKDTVEENVQKLGVTRWRSVAEDCQTSSKTAKVNMAVK